MNWRALLFGETPRAPIDRRRMNEDWRVGDLAECVIDTWVVPCAGHPRCFDVLRVSGIYEGPTIDGRFLVYALRFEGKPANHGWDATAFRKLTPRIEPATEEFTRELRDMLASPAPTCPAPSGQAPAAGSGSLTFGRVDDGPGGFLGRAP